MAKKRDLKAIPEDLNLGCQAPECKKKRFPYPETLVRYWKMQDMEKALELIFRDFSWHLQRGMSVDIQQEFFDLIMDEIEGLGFKNEQD